MSTDDVPKLSSKESLILRLLVNHGEMYGLQLVEHSEGHLLRGTVYVTLGRMLEKGYVTSEQETRAPGVPGIPRRLYRITGLGERVLRANQASRAASLAIFGGALPEGVA
jgi:DNA-binding PadR family transcriptional regulator